MSLDRLPEIKNAVTHILDLFRQQMSERQVKKYEKALYLARTQEVGLQILEDIQAQLKRTTILHEVNTLRHKFNACNALQKIIYDTPSSHYAKALTLLLEMKEVSKCKTDDAAQKVLKNLPEGARPKAKTQKATQPKTATKAKTVQVEEPQEPMVGFVKNNVLGLTQTEAKNLMAALKVLVEDAA